MKSLSEHRLIDPERPDAGIIKAAADMIHRGGVVLFPTRLLYGLGADAANPSAVDRLFRLKGRPRNKPILLLISRKAWLADLAVDIPPAAQRLMDQFWPGRVTLVFRAKPTIYHGLTAGSGNIGIRLCAHPVSVALTEAVGRPITGTSANRSGEPGGSRLSDLHRDLLEGTDLALDAGPLRGGTGSSVVDVTVEPPKVLREGAVTKREILAAIDGNRPKGIDITR